MTLKEVIISTGLFISFLCSASYADVFPRIVLEDRSATNETLLGHLRCMGYYKASLVKSTPFGEQHLLILGANAEHKPGLQSSILIDELAARSPKRVIAAPYESFRVALSKARTKKEARNHPPRSFLEYALPSDERTLSQPNSKEQILHLEYEGREGEKGWAQQLSAFVDAHQRPTQVLVFFDMRGSNGAVLIPQAAAEVVKHLVGEYGFRIHPGLRSEKEPKTTFCR